MRWCRCYEGQRAEAGGCQDPSRIGLSIIRTTTQVSQVHRFRRRSRKPLWGRAAETEEPECTWEWRVWEWGVYGMIRYVHERRSTIFDGQPPSRSWRNASTPDHGFPYRQFPRSRWNFRFDGKKKFVSNSIVLISLLIKHSHSLSLPFPSVTETWWPHLIFN